MVGKFGGGFLGQLAGGSFTHNRWYASLFYDGPAGAAFGGLDTGFIVHYIGQYWDIKEFTHPTSFTEEGEPRFLVARSVNGSRWIGCSIIHLTSRRPQRKMKCRICQRWRQERDGDGG